MENKNSDNSQVGNLFICIDNQNSELIDSTFTTTTINRNQARYQEALEYLNDESALYFELFHSNIQQQYKNSSNISDITFYWFQIQDADMQQITRFHKPETENNYILSTVLPYIEKNNLPPVEEHHLLYFNSNLKIGGKAVNSANIEYLLRKYAALPYLTMIIVTWLKKNPLRKFENKEAIFDALKATQYYQDNKLDEICNLNKTNTITNLHLLIGNLKGMDKSFLSTMYDLLIFQRSHQKHELINQIWAYRHRMEITKKQIDLCTSRLDYLLYPEDLYTAFQHTTYYREFINENITQEGPEPFHLLLAARKLKYANSIKERIGKISGFTEKIYWILKEEGIKDWLSIQIGLLKKLPAIKTPQIERILKFLERDIKLGIKRKFYGMDSIIRDVKMLNEKINNNVPFDSKVLAPKRISIETENLPSIPFERFHIYEFSGNLKDHDIGTLKDSEGFAISIFPVEVSQAIDAMTLRCPILNPVFHCKLRFKDPETWLKYSEVKNFVKDFLNELGYGNNPFVVTYSHEHEMHIFTPNIIYYKNAYHPICTVQNHSNALQALYLLEQRYDLLKETTQQQLDQFIQKNQPDNKPDTPDKDKHKGMKI